MFNSVHVAAAAAIVTLVPNPWIGVPLAFVSHIALDTIPHWNWRPGGNIFRFTGSVGDILLAGVLSVLFASRSSHPVTMLLACLLSTVPDLIQGPYYFFEYKPGWLKTFIGWESRRQKWPWMPKWVGIVTQLVTLTIALIIIFK